MGFVTDPTKLSESRIQAQVRDFSDRIAFSDYKIAFAVEGVENCDVLDIGCVEHDPENYNSHFWVHKAICARAKSVTGLDLSTAGVEFLQNVGFDVVHADAQNFDLARKFDVIFAGDIIEHLEDFSGFLNSCKNHLKPLGQIRISTPNPWYWKNVVRAAIFTEVHNNPEHTCWLCPRTLRQLLSRHDLEPVEFRFGSRYWRDRIIPLPRGLKHTSWNVVIKRRSEI